MSNYSVQQSNDNGGEEIANTFSSFHVRPVKNRPARDRKRGKLALALKWPLFACLRTKIRLCRVCSTTHAGKGSVKEGRCRTIVTKMAGLGPHVHTRQQWAFNVFVNIACKSPLPGHISLSKRRSHAIKTISIMQAGEFNLSDEIEVAAREFSLQKRTL